MTDKTQPHAGSTHIIRYALELGLLWIDGDGRDKVREALDALDTLESQLEAIGAGGVSGPLVGRAAPPTAQAEGWISVDERLPEHEQSVAFVVRTDGFQQHLNGCVLGGFFVRGQRFFVPGLGLEASHWMPLPPPPTSAEGVEHG